MQVRLLNRLVLCMLVSQSGSMPVEKRSTIRYRAEQTGSREAQTLQQFFRLSVGGRWLQELSGSRDKQRGRASDEDTSLLLVLVVLLD